MHPTRFGHCLDHRQPVVQEYNHYISKCTKMYDKTVRYYI